MKRITQIALTALLLSGCGFQGGDEYVSTVPSERESVHNESTEIRDNPDAPDGAVDSGDFSEHRGNSAAERGSSANESESAGPSTHYLDELKEGPHHYGDFSEFSDAELEAVGQRMCIALKEQDNRDPNDLDGPEKVARQYLPGDWSLLKMADFTRRVQYVCPGYYD